MINDNCLELNNILFELKKIFGSYWYNELLENFRYMSYHNNFEEYNLQSLKLFCEENMRILEEKKFSYLNFCEIDNIIFNTTNIILLYQIRYDRLRTLKKFKRSIFRFIKSFRRFKIKKYNYELITNPVLRFLNQEIHYENIFIMKIYYKLTTKI